MSVSSWKVGGVGRLLSLNLEQKVQQVVLGPPAHPVFGSEPSCSLGPPRWQRLGERAAELRGGLKASRGGVLVYRLGANPVRWSGRFGARWLASDMSKAAVWAFAATEKRYCRSSARCA